jgi:hypothetical protein
MVAGTVSYEHERKRERATIPAEIFGATSELNHSLGLSQQLAYTYMYSRADAAACDY